jgi:hypothetical protein
MRHMVDMAEGVVRGTFSSQEAGFLAGDYYHDGFPRWFWAPDNYGLPYTVECAYYAAHSAILTACGRDPLFRVGRVKRSGNAYVMGDFEQDDTDPEWRDSRDMTDLELTHAYSGDAAAYAMVAFSADSTADFKEAKQEKVLSPELKLTFWEWWLTQAVPEALRLATVD